jgi:hypothetical protein
MADQMAALIRREEVAEGTMAFHFEKPSGFSFGAGQFADAVAPYKYGRVPSSGFEHLHIDGNIKGVHSAS